MAELYVTLLHYPVYDSHGTVTPTSLVSLDIHDIARSAITFGVKGYFVVHPVPEMRRLGEDILNYWLHGPGQVVRPDRKLALTRVEIVPTLDEALREIEREEGCEPVTVATSARGFAGSIRYDMLAGLVRQPGPPLLLMFGTGHGLVHEIIEAVDYILEPIRGRGDYNHLSVRAAAAIILDRIVGDRRAPESG